MTAVAFLHPDEGVGGKAVLGHFGSDRFGILLHLAYHHFRGNRPCPAGNLDRGGKNLYSGDLVFGAAYTPDTELT